MMGVRSLCFLILLIVAIITASEVEAQQSKPDDLIEGCDPTGSDTTLGSTTTGQVQLSSGSGADLGGARGPADQHGGTGPALIPRGEATSGKNISGCDTDTSH